MHIFMYVDNETWKSWYQNVVNACLFYLVVSYITSLFKGLQKVGLKWYVCA